MSKEQTLFADIRAYFMAHHLHDIEKIVVDPTFYGKLCKRFSRDFPDFTPMELTEVMGIEIGLDQEFSADHEHKITIYTKRRKSPVNEEQRKRCDWFWWFIEEYRDKV